MDMKEFLGEVASNMGSHRKTLDLELCFAGCLATENSNLQNLARHQQWHESWTGRSAY